MDEHINERLTAIENKLEENNRILVRMRRVQRNSQLFRLFYWLVIVGLTLGAFYYIEPYLKQLTQIYSGIQDTQQNIQKAIPDIGNVQNLLDQLKGL